MKKIIILPIIIAIAIIALSASTVINASGQYAWTGSPVDGGIVNGTCALCHSGGASIPTLTVSTSPALGTGNTYAPGQTYTVTADVAGSYSKYGFNCEIITSTSTVTTNVNTLGTFGAAVTSNCQIYPFSTTTPYPITASHNAASGSANAASFSWQWTAPISGTGYLYCVGLGVNLDATSGGDKVTAVKTLTLTPAGIGIASHSENAPALNIFPNPATDNVHITYMLKERSNVILKLYNLSGELVADLLNEIQGRGPQTADVRLPMGIAKGMYMVKLTINGKQVIEKLLVY